MANQTLSELMPAWKNAKPESTKRKELGRLILIKLAGNERSALRYMCRVGPIVKGNNSAYEEASVKLIAAGLAVKIAYRNSFGSIAATSLGWDLFSSFTTTSEAEL